MNRRVISQLPFDPSETKVIQTERQGVKETITYEYKGKRYQEVRVRADRPPYPAAFKPQVEAIQKEFAVDEMKAYDLLVKLWPHQITNAPEPLRSDPCYARHQAWRSKNVISQWLGSDDPKKIERVVKFDFGHKFPPMADFVVRKSAGDEPLVPKQTPPDVPK